VGGGLGEAEVGGPHINIIPRSGGNTFAGQAFAQAAGDWSRSNNIDDELRSFGITEPEALRSAWDVSGSYGGPIKRDRLWFYGNVRNYGDATVRPTAIGPNIHAGDPNSWAYEEDTSFEEVRDVNGRDIFSGRVTAQLGNSRVGFSQEYQNRCDGTTRTREGDGCRQPGENWTGLGTNSAFGSSSAEADAGILPLPYYLTQATWTLPVTNRLLLEAGFSRLQYVPGFGQVPSDGIFDLIPVTEQSRIDGHPSNFTYRAIDDYLKNKANPNNFRASASYVTGSHAMKFGYQHGYDIADFNNFYNQTRVNYRFDNGVPNRFTMQLGNWRTKNRTNHYGLYAQDQWTINRFTLQGAVRYERAWSWFPEGQGWDGPDKFHADPITFPRTEGVPGFNDIMFRGGIAWD
ncbi:MAG: TonB-dependent receptor domain-containing protein, partial [Planctomycetaceae bacterium]